MLREDELVDMRFDPNQLFKSSGFFVSFHYLLMVVDGHVFRSSQNHKILASIIKLISIYVMNMLIRVKKSTNLFLHYEPMFKDAAFLCIGMCLGKNLVITGPTNPLFFGGRSRVFDSLCVAVAELSARFRTMYVFFVRGQKGVATFFADLFDIRLPCISNPICSQVSSRNWFSPDSIDKLFKSLLGRDFRFHFFNYSLDGDAV